MTDTRIDLSNLDAVSAAGVVVTANRLVGADFKLMGCTLLASTTYYFPFGTFKTLVPSETPLVTVQAIWDATVIITSVSIETTIVPGVQTIGDPGSTAQLTDFDTTAGFWLLQNPTTAYVPVTSGTVTNMTVAPVASARGGCEFDLGNFGARRGRAKVVVAGTGGIVRVGLSCKAAA